MNRKERRAAQRRSSKPTGRRHGVFKPLAWQQISAHMTLSSNAPLHEQSRNSIILPAYQALDELSRGHGDVAGFLTLVEMNYFGHRLAQRLAEFSNASDVLQRTEQEFTAAGDALAEIGERSNRIGRFTPTGGELQAIRTSMQMLDELLGLSNTGHTLVALKQASADIEATQRATAAAIG